MTACKTANVRRGKRVVAPDYPPISGDCGFSEKAMPSLLEQCANTAADNIEATNNIGNRLVLLLERLRGSEPRGEVGDDSKASPSRGRLNDHLDDLQWQQQRLIDIQNDLSLLESLL